MLESHLKPLGLERAGSMLLMEPVSDEDQYCSTCFSMTSTVEGLRALTSPMTGFRHHIWTAFDQCPFCKLCDIIFELLDKLLFKRRGIRWQKNPSKPAYFQANKDARYSSRMEYQDYPLREGSLDTISVYLLGNLMAKVDLTVFVQEGRW